METKTAGRAGAGLIVLFCFFIAFLEGYDIQSFGVAAPKLIPEFGLNPGQQGWVGSAAMLGLVIGAFGGGWIADRIGRKPVLIGSVAAFGLFSLATAMTHGYPELLAVRVGAGLGFGGVMPNLMALAAEISAPDRKAGTVTAMFCGMPAGGAAVSLLARLGGAELDWRTIFLVGGGLPLLLIPLAFFLLPETRPQAAPHADHRWTTTLFAEGRTAGTLLLWTIFFGTAVVLYLMLNWLPTLVTAKGFTPGDGSTAALGFNVMAVVGALVMGYAIDRVGFRWPTMAIFATLMAAMAGLAFVAQLSPLLVLSAIAGFGVVGGQFSFYAVAPMLYPAHVRAAGAGAAVAVGRMGSIVGPLLAGELRQAGYSAGQVFGALIPVVLTAGVAAFALSFLGKLRDD